MKPARFITAVSIAVGVLVLTASGCSDPYEEVDESCNSNAQCPLGWFCNRTVEQCEHEVDNRIVGTFSCEFTQSAGDSVSYFGASDIATWLGLQGGARPLRVTVNASAQCNFSPNGGEYGTLGFDSTGTMYQFGVILPYPRAGTFDIIPYDSEGEVPDTVGFAGIWALPPGGTNSIQIATAVQGFVYLDTDPAPGTIPSMYVDIVMAPLL